MRHIDVGGGVACLADNSTTFRFFVDVFTNKDM
jgi:hypothetical protein